MSIGTSTRITTRLMSFVHKPTVPKEVLMKNRPRYRVEDVLSNPSLLVLNAENSAAKVKPSGMPMELLAKVMTEQETNITKKVLRK
ncbi:unnamed protein product [Cunninghamella echinulata]